MAANQLCLFLSHLCLKSSDRSPELGLLTDELGLGIAALSEPLFKKQLKKSNNEKRQVGSSEKGHDAEAEAAATSSVEATWQRIARLSRSVEACSSSSLMTSNTRLRSSQAATYSLCRTASPPQIGTNVP
jgi:hypothetical protein